MNKELACRFCCEYNIPYLVADKYNNKYPVIAIHFGGRYIEAAISDCESKELAFNELAYAFSFDDNGSLKNDSALHKIIRGK